MPRQDDQDLPPAAHAGRWRYAWLVIPFLWQLALAPLINDVAWRPFGLPFPMVWQMVGILVTSLVLWQLYRTEHADDDANDVEGQP